VTVAGVAAVAAALVAATAGRAAPLRAGDARAGERLYRTGVGASGAPVPALVQGDVPIDGSTVSCASCHLGSGFGSLEGNQVAPSLRWHRLAAAGMNGNGRRRAYDPETLLRAVTEGLDPEGRPLSPLMPRYRLEPRDRENLAAFLRSRGRPSSPGVRDGRLTIAAVVTPDADPEARRATEAVLAQFREHANFRRTRKSHGPRPLSADGTPEPEALGYRDWRLAIWALEGPPDGWRAQLEARHAATPVFALLSGLGASTWEPVHRFCEDRRIPCILPNVDAPPSRDRPGPWSLYYSGGVELEAEVMARSIPRDGTIAQVSRRGTAGAAGAARLRRLRPVVDLEPASPVPPGVDVLVLWLPSAEAARYAASASAQPWISATAAGPGALPPKAIVVSPHAHPPGAAASARFEAWARGRALSRGDFRVQEQTFFACQLLAHALSHMHENLDRELLIEVIEHAAAMEGFSASYPRLSFGAGQRFLSKGAWVLGPEPAGPREWVVP
jgi:hypothetical protein